MSGVPAGACCKHCGYELEHVTGSRCPECGRGFDRADMGTYAPSVRAWKRRKWRRRGVVAAVVIAGAAVLVPRGYVRATMTVTCPGCGLMRTAVSTRPFGPSWNGTPLWVWPGWTKTTVGAAPVTADTCDHDPCFYAMAVKKMWSIRGERAAGGAMGSANGNSKQLGTLNKVVVTFESMERAAETVTLDMARSQVFGLDVGKIKRKKVEGELPTGRVDR